jgi:hypothetical protein
MTTPYKGKYTSFNTVSLKKRYFLMQAQRNTPLLDSEVRELSQTSVLLTKWLARNSFGDLAVLDYTFSEKDGSVNHRNLGFRCGPVNPTTPYAPENSGNFRIFGGNNGNGNNDYPAAMYIKGWYAFLNSDILYNDQNSDIEKGCDPIVKEYPTEVIPTSISPDSEKQKFAIRHDAFTQESPATVSSGTPGQKDVVYVEITFDEVTSTGAGQEYVDPSLKDPVVGSNTANRVRASMSFIVKENWTGFTDASIFQDPFFQSGTYDTGVSYIRAPISLITRTVNNYLLSENFSDLLTIHDKRVYPPKEITHRLKHGGYTQMDVTAGRATQDQVDERWEAQGKDEGIATEAYNTSSVTPRVLSKTSDFRMQSLAVAGVTGAQGETGFLGTIQPDPDGLLPGEITSHQNFAEKSFLRGNDLTTIERARELSNKAIEVMDVTGTTGPGNIWHTSDKKVGAPGVTTKGSAWQQEYHEGGSPDGVVVAELDYKGDLALGKAVQGASGYQLDVAGRSSFDSNMDMRGDLLQVWNDLGVSGTAFIFDLQAQRQSHMFRTKNLSSGTVPYSKADYKFWKLCTVSLGAANSGSSFKVSVMSNDSLGNLTCTEITLETSTGTTMTPAPTAQVTLRDSHNVVKDVVQARLVTNTGSLKTIELYIGCLPDAGKFLTFGVSEYSEKGTGVSLHCWGDLSAVTWSVPGALPGTDMGPTEYGKDHKSLFKAERTAYHTLNFRVPAGGYSNHAIAWRQRYSGPGASENPKPWETAQEFFVKVRRNAEESLGSFFVQINEDSFGHAYVTVRDFVWDSAGNPNKLLEVSLRFEQYASYSRREMLAIGISNTLPTQENLFFEVSEDPMQGAGINKNPYILAGSEDVVADASDITMQSTEILASVDMDYSNGGVKAIATNAPIVLKGPAFLDMSASENQHSSGVTGENTAYILDKLGRKGNAGQVLTATKEGAGKGYGVLWTNSAFIEVSSIEELRALSLDCGASTVYLSGYYKRGDGDSGFFCAKETTDPDDTGTLIRNPLFPDRAWQRQVEGNKVSVNSFGAITEIVASEPVNRDTQILKAISVAKEKGYSLEIPPGSLYKVATDIMFPEGVSLEIGNGSFFYFDGVGTRPVITFAGPTEIKADMAITNPLNGARLSFYPTALREVYPEWWYALGDGVEDSTAAIVDMYQSLRQGIVSGVHQSIKVVFGKIEQTVAEADRSYVISDLVLMTSPTEFAGGAILKIVDEGRFSVRDTLTAPNRTIFSYPMPSSPDGYDYYYSCASGYITWDEGANENINVTWFGVRPGVTSEILQGNYDAVTKMVANFSCMGSQAVYYFPVGRYSFRGVYGAINFKEALLEMAPGAEFDTADTVFWLRGFTDDTPSTRFCFVSGDDPSAYHIPRITSGDIQVEWFRSEGFSDKSTLAFAIASLLEACRLDVDPSLATDKSYWMNRWLTGSGRVYYLSEDLIFKAGLSTSTGSYYGFGGGIKDMTWSLRSGMYVSTSEVGGMDTTAVVMEGWNFENLLVDGAYSDGRFQVAFARGATFRNCRFANHTQLDSAGSLAFSYYSFGVRFLGCTFDDSYVAMSAGTMEGCTFNISADFAGILNSTPRHALAVSGVVIVSNNLFKVENSESNILARCIALGMSSTGSSVSSNTFINGKMYVLTGNGVSITGNYFRANGYTPNVLTEPVMMPPLDTFITLSGSSSEASASSCAGLTITGNRFFEKDYTTVIAGNYSDTEINPVSGAITYIDKAELTNFEAIKVDGYFNPLKIWDCVVKDNVGTRGVNIRATELTEIRFVRADAIDPNVNPGNYVCPRWEGVWAGGGLNTVTHSNRRLFGLPQGPLSVTLTARNPVNGQDFSGLLLGSASMYSYDSEAPWIVKVMHVAANSTSLVLGKPAGYTMVMRVTFRTYQERMGSINAGADLNGDSYYWNFNMNGENLHRG